MTKKTLEQSSTSQYTKKLENVRNKPDPTIKDNLFSNHDIIALGEFWIQRHEVDDEINEEYNKGVIAGVEYMLYLLEGCGDCGNES